MIYDEKSPKQKCLQHSYGGFSLEKPEIHEPLLLSNHPFCPVVSPVVSPLFGKLWVVLLSVGTFLCSPECAKAMGSQLSPPDYEFGLGLKASQN